MEIYQPSDDSYFFADLLKKYLVSTIHHPPSTIQFLDMGTGSGILAKTASKFLPPKNITAIDINPDAIKQLQKEKFQVIQSDLFQAFHRTSRAKEEHKSNQLPNTRYQIPLSEVKFDLITFNAPYLPRDSREPKSSQLATTGGKHGDEISIKFLKQAKHYLSKNGKILLLISSLTPTDKIKKLWNYRIVARKKVFMEELLILEFKN